MFSTNYENWDGISSYYMSHMEGVYLYYIMSKSCEWEAQEDLIWTRGDDKVELVVIRLEDLTKEEYHEELLKHPNFKANFKVWGRTFKELKEIEDFLLFGDKTVEEQARYAVEHYHADC